MRGVMLADRYAQALHLALGDGPQLETASRALNEISGHYEDIPNIRHVLDNSALDVDGRRKILDVLLSDNGAPEAVKQLLYLLLQHNRMSLLGSVASRFESHIDEWFNRIEVTVVTAVPLTSDIERRLIASLESFTSKSVRMKKKVDPNIVGGLIVYIFDVLFDFSLRTRLDRMKEKLLSEVVLDAN